MIPAEKPASVTATVSVQRVAVQRVPVIRATGAAMSCWFCDGDWLVRLARAAGDGGVGTVAVHALCLKARPPPLCALTTQPSWLPTSALLTT